MNLGPRAGDIVASIEDLVFAAASVVVFLGPQPPPMPIAPPPTPTPEPSPVDPLRGAVSDDGGGIYRGLTGTPSPTTSPAPLLGDDYGAAGGDSAAAAAGVAGLDPVVTAWKRGADGASGGAVGRRHSSPWDVPWSSVPNVMKPGLTDGVPGLGEVCMYELTLLK